MNRRESIKMMAAATGTMLLFDAGTDMLHAAQDRGHVVGRNSAFEARTDGSVEALAAQKPPADFLTNSFSHSVLETSLLSAEAWHPLPTIKERSPWLALSNALRDALTARGEHASGTPWESLTATAFLDFSRTGNRTNYEHAYFRRRQKLCDMVLAECVEARGRFLDEIANGAWLLCDEAFWGVPAHLTLQKDGIGLPDVTEPIIDLFAAETSSTLAWILYLLGDELNQISPRIVERVSLEQKRRILDPLLRRTDFGWMGLQPNHANVNNWNPWILSNCIATTLLLEHDRSRRAALISKSCECLDRFLADYSPDGGCEEGPVYWQRSAASYFDCCWLLTSATRAAAKPLSHPFVRRMGHYIVDVHIADRFYVNYGDAHAEDAPTPELMYRFGIATADDALEAFGAFASRQTGLASDPQTIQQAISAGMPSLARTLQDVLVVPQIANARAKDALSRDAWYPALGLMTARRSAGSTEGFFLAVQASGNGRSHGHNDTGSFIVFMDGRPLFVDAGVEAYTAKTFSKERYSIWTMQSAYHNLPTVGGVMQHEGLSFRASDVMYRCDNSAASLSMNLAEAYPKEAGIARWFRKVTLERERNAVTISEDFALRQSQPVTLSFMTPCRPDISEAGVVGLGAGQGQENSVRLCFDSSQLKAKVETIVLNDEGLKRDWGPALYRLLLESQVPVGKGAWKFTMEKSGSNEGMER